MGNKLKSLFGLVLIGVIVSLGYSAVILSKSYSRSVKGQTESSFFVSAEGRTVAIPDIATFSFSVISDNKKELVALQNDNTAKVNKAIEYVKTAGVDNKDIRTENYSVEPRYLTFGCIDPNSRTCPPPVITSYSISQTVSVKIRDFAKISDILSGIVKNGANSVSGLSFAIDDRTEVENTARTEAIAKAKTKALGIAKAGNFRLGRLVSIEENASGPAYGYAMMEKATMSGGAVGAQTPAIEPGSQDVNITVTLRYEIEN